MSKFLSDDADGQIDGVYPNQEVDFDLSTNVGKTTIPNTEKMRPEMGVEPFVEIEETQVGIVHSQTGKTVKVLTGNMIYIDATTTAIQSNRKYRTGQEVIIRRGRREDEWLVIGDKTTAIGGQHTFEDWVETEQWGKPCVTKTGETLTIIEAGWYEIEVVQDYTGNEPSVTLAQAPAGGVPRRLGTSPGLTNVTIQDSDPVIAATARTKLVKNWASSEIAANGSRYLVMIRDRADQYIALADDCNDSASGGGTGGPGPVVLSQPNGTDVTYTEPENGTTTVGITTSNMTYTGAITNISLGGI